MTKFWTLSETNDQVVEESHLNTDNFSVYQNLVRIGISHLAPVHEHRKMSIDMDGVLIWDDNAKTAVDIIGGKAALKYFDIVANLNVTHRNLGQAPYCWHAPGMFSAHMLQGLSTDINSAIGSSVRLIPGAKDFCELVQQLGVELHTITAGHHDAAIEVAKRVGIQSRRTHGTILGTDAESLYTGTIERFIGGVHKLHHAYEVLDYFNPDVRGMHIGDSWSDIETLAGIQPSIAFNAGCPDAARGATINVVGSNLMCLLPFFDHDRTYEHRYQEYEVPELVVVNASGLPLDDVVCNQICETAKEVKEGVIKRRVDSALSEEAFMQALRARLAAEGVDTTYQSRRFPTLADFSAQALESYLDYEHPQPMG